MRQTVVSFSSDLRRTQGGLGKGTKAWDDSRSRGDVPQCNNADRERELQMGSPMGKGCPRQALLFGSRAILESHCPRIHFPQSSHQSDRTSRRNNANLLESQTSSTERSRRFGRGKGDW